MGLWISGTALLSIPIVAGLRVALGREFFGGQATTLISVLFLGGVQLIFLGIMGEYLARLHSRMMARPPYVIRERTDSQP